MRSVAIAMAAELVTVLIILASAAVIMKLDLIGVWILEGFLP